MSPLFHVMSLSPVSDRYYAISQPLRYVPVRTHRLIGLSVLCVNLTAALVSAPSLVDSTSGLATVTKGPGELEGWAISYIIPLFFTLFHVYIIFLIVHLLCQNL